MIECFVIALCTATEFCSVICNLLNVNYLLIVAGDKVRRRLCINT